MKDYHNPHRMGIRPPRDLYKRIYEVVRMIPAGKVATYGQIASIVGHCTPRQVGYAMAAVRSGSNVPWHRVINSKGMISVRAYGAPCALQRKFLEIEGLTFDENGSVDLKEVGWAGPIKEIW